MANNRKPAKTKKSTNVSLISFGVTAMLFALIFHPHQGWSLALMLVVSFLVSWLAGIMSTPLNTKAPHSSKEKEVNDLLSYQPTGNQEVDDLVMKSRDMLQQIRHENDLIPDQALSNQIFQLEEITGKIFQTVIDQPKKAPQIRKFMSYYLPTTLKMLASYRKMDERGVYGENADQARKKITGAMSLVIKAFDKQLDTLYQNDMLDITTDVDVLEQMLKRDGLSDEGTLSAEQRRQTEEMQKSAEAISEAAAKVKEQSAVCDAISAADELTNRLNAKEGPIVLELPKQKQKEEVHE
ncbi:MAG: 5-bromo-4-chloroindolyl phosphate hydrolysis family protein [Eubacteriales bacterium]|nr:5-bromo-4-chloroindolyl phosphate hydrolysis family protein [Eubacteriales bacterium]MDD3883111.1 5-bromo-4-chloroindolyl phosphate hydrolysis family protein [Eubacteriales bacterium]MDD4513319.1 5-bromo-4-chloroindolyl phosphate hydrolysis family protein [Eubacteriales bacterium]